MTQRLWVDEKRRFLTEKGFEIAQAIQRFQNAFTWYQSKPTLAHLDSMRFQHQKIGAIINEISDQHGEVAPSTLTDPEREER